MSAFGDVMATLDSWLPSRDSNPDQRLQRPSSGFRRPLCPVRFSPASRDCDASDESCCRLVLGQPQDYITGQEALPRRRSSDGTGRRPAPLSSTRPDEGSKKSSLRSRNGRHFWLHLHGAPGATGRPTGTGRTSVTIGRIGNRVNLLDEWHSSGPQDTIPYCGIRRKIIWNQVLLNESYFRNDMGYIVPTILSIRIIHVYTWLLEQCRIR